MHLPSGPFTLIGNPVNTPSERAPVNVLLYILCIAAGSRSRAQEPNITEAVQDENLPFWGHAMLAGALGAFCWSHS